MRTGPVPNKGFNSRLAKDLNPTEKVVLTILEMGNTDSDATVDFGPIENDDDVPEEEEEEEMEEDDMIGLQNSPNGTFDSTSISKSYQDYLILKELIFCDHPVAI